MQSSGRRWPGSSAAARPYLLLLECPKSAVDELGVPASSRARSADELDDSDYEALCRWADPELPHLPVSSYAARLTVDDVRRVANRAR